MSFPAESQLQLPSFSSCPAETDRLWIPDRSIANAFDALLDEHLQDDSAVTRRPTTGVVLSYSETHDSSGV